MFLHLMATISFFTPERSEIFEWKVTMKHRRIKLVINKIIRIFERWSFTVEDRVLQGGGQVGKGVFWGKDVLLDYDYTFLLAIEDGAVISARTIIELHDSSLPNVLGKGKNKIGRVHIGKRSYIGVNSVILPGVRIGDGAIIGACSLVNCSVPDREVWAGVPVRRIGTVDELVHKRELSDRPDIGFFDWIGELEKLEIDYYGRKKRLIKDVKKYFTIKE